MHPLHTSISTQVSRLEPYRDPPCQLSGAYDFFLPHSRLPHKYLWKEKMCPPVAGHLTPELQKGSQSRYFCISLNATVHTKPSLCKSLSQSEANTCSISTRDAQQGCEALYQIWLTGNQYYKQTHNKGSITATMHKPTLCYSANTCKVCVSSGKSSFQLCGNIQWHNIPETGIYCKQTHMLIPLNRVIHHSIFSCALVPLWQGLLSSFNLIMHNPNCLNYNYRWKVVLPSTKNVLWREQNRN